METGMPTSTARSAEETLLTVKKEDATQSIVSEKENDGETTASTGRKRTHDQVESSYDSDRKYTEAELQAKLSEAILQTRQELEQKVQSSLQQATKAETDLEFISREHQSSKNEIATLQHQVEAIKKFHSEICSHFQLDATSSDSQQAFAQAHANLVAQVATCQETKSQLEEKYTSQTKDLMEARARIESLEQQNVKYQHTETILAQNMAYFRQGETTTSGDRPEALLQEKDNQLSTLKKELGRMEKEMKDITKYREELARRNAELEAKKQELEESLVKVQESVDTKEKERLQMKEQNDRLKDENHELSRIASEVLDTMEAQKSQQDDSTITSDEMQQKRQKVADATD